MSPASQRLYNTLPTWARSIAASAYGAALRRQRYGPETDFLVAEALERERWSQQRWRQWQERRLAHVLERAATRAPYYRELWRQRRKRGDRRSFERLENWPILGKEDVRRDPAAFVADDRRFRAMHAEHTSGTTGTPLTLYRTRQTIRARYALYEARHLRWNGLDRHATWAMLGGRLVTPVSQNRPPFWVWNRALHQLYLSSYHLSPKFLPSYLQALRNYEVRYLVGYPSALHALARTAAEIGEHVPMQAVIANAEPLFPHQRHMIERAFGPVVRETYGMVELVSGASECEHGRLHLWPEFGITEILRAGVPVPAGETGDLICTSLLDDNMPLIRYRVGDRGSLAPAGRRCPCGRTLPLLDNISGRCDDILYTPDGREIGRLDPVFKSSLHLREAQIIQEALGRFRVLVVPGRGYTSGENRLISQALRERVGQARITVETTGSIPRGSNGKFRAVISHLPPETLSALRNSNSQAAAQA